MLSVSNVCENVTTIYLLPQFKLLCELHVESYLLLDLSMDIFCSIVFRICDRQ